ncbi:MAG: hypothetical protein RL757_3406 [Bacteroidota bacterium]|jgi:hypothetical protein
MKKYHFLMPILSLLLLTNCKGLFDFNKDIVLEEQPPKMVLISDLVVGQSDAYVFLTRTRTPNGVARWDFNVGDTIYKNPTNPNDFLINKFPNVIAYDTVRNATVLLYENDSLIATLRQKPTEVKGVYSAEFNRPIMEGKTYKIKAYAPGFDTIEATQRAPKSVPLQQLRFQKDIFTLNNYLYDGLTLRFQDPAGLGDNYSFTAFWTDTSNAGLTNNVAIYKVENIATDYDLLADRLFDGQTFNWQVGIVISGNIGNNFGRVKTLTVRFRTVSSDFEAYRRSYIQLQNSIGNPFVEPFQLFSNVKNGLGVFSMSGRETTLTVPYR